MADQPRKPNSTEGALPSQDRFIEALARILCSAAVRGSDRHSWTDL